MTKRIRILEIINEATIGGGQAHVFSLATGLDKTVFDVCVACSNNGPLVEDLRARGVRVVTADITRKPSLATLSKLRRIMRRHRIDIVHAHGGVAGLWGRLAALLEAIPARIYTLHGIHYLNYGNWVKRTVFVALERVLSFCTDRIICVSEADRRAGLRAGCFTERRCKVILNGIPFPSLPARFNRRLKKTELGIPHGAPVVGTVGRLHFQKGQRHLLEAASMVLKDIPNVRVLIVGEGPMRGELEALAENLGIRKSVHFAGARRDAAELLAVMDVFILSSEWEGLPLSLLEALALSRPVVAHAIDGVTEIVEHGRSGLLVPVGKTDALAGAVTRLLRDRGYAERLAARGRETVLARFGREKMVHATAELYLELFQFSAAVRNLRLKKHG
jgi:glycosyltransferase involved in cell wall biosynthesis